MKLNEREKQLLMAAFKKLIDRAETVSGTLYSGVEVLFGEGEILGTPRHTGHHSIEIELNGGAHSHREDDVDIISLQRLFEAEVEQIPKAKRTAEEKEILGRRKKAEAKPSKRKGRRRRHRDDDDDDDDDDDYDY